MALDADEKDVCRFLKSFPGEFVGLREICRRASGKNRFKEDPEWAAPVLARLVEKRFVEGDSSGHFRLLPRENVKPKWVSPQLRKILEKSGKTFDLPNDDDDEF